MLGAGDRDVAEFDRRAPSYERQTCLSTAAVPGGGPWAVGVSSGTGNFSTLVPFHSADRGGGRRRCRHPPATDARARS
jgi:hypothetical protein